MNFFVLFSTIKCGKLWKILFFECKFNKLCLFWKKKITTKIFNITKLKRKEPFQCYDNGKIEHMSDEVTITCRQTDEIEKLPKWMRTE